MNAESLGIGKKSCVIHCAQFAKRDHVHAAESDPVPFSLAFTCSLLRSHPHQFNKQCEIACHSRNLIELMISLAVQDSAVGAGVC